MPNVHQLALVKLAAQPNIQSALVWLTSQLSAPLCPWVRDDHMRSSLEDPVSTLDMVLKSTCLCVLTLFLQYTVYNIPYILVNRYFSIFISIIYI